MQWKQNGLTEFTGIFTAYSGEAGLFSAHIFTPWHEWACRAV